MPKLRNGITPPDSWTGGDNRWTREKLRTYQDWMRNPKGTDMHQDAGKRSKGVSYGQSEASIEELYQQMVRRGLVNDVLTVRETGRTRRTEKARRK